MGHEMTDVVFPEGTGLIPPYAVPASDWVVINDRVAIAVEAQNIASEIEKYIPNYPDLLRVCTKWRSATWSGLIAQAVDTELFANNAATVLGQLSCDLSGLKPDDPVPASVSFIITVQFQAMAQTAGQQGTTASGLVNQIAAFVSANRAADASLEKLPLDGWSSIAGPIGALETATADIQTAWGAIASQLQAAAGGQMKITTAGLLASNLSTAITSWKELAKAAGDFVSMASNLTSEVAS
jgi:hypothetical protein